MANNKLVHDFNNQLGIILGFLELLIDETGQEDARRADFLEMQKAARRALELVPELAAQLKQQA